MQEKTHLRILKIYDNISLAEVFLLSLYPQSLSDDYVILTSTVITDHTITYLLILIER